MVEQIIKNKKCPLLIVAIGDDKTGFGDCIKDECRAYENGACGAFAVNKDSCPIWSEPLGGEAMSLLEISIARCKDCVHSYRVNGSRYCKQPFGEKAGYSSVSVKDNSFCDKSEKKIDDIEERLQAGDIQYEHDKFETAVKPLIKYMAENHHPHMKLIVDCDSAELFESHMVVMTDEYIED